MKPRTNKPTRPFKNTVLCFCEGETEKVYLTCLKKDRYKNVHIELKPQISNAGFKNIFYDIEQLLAEPPETNYKYIFYVLDMDVIYGDNRINEYKNQKKSVESLDQAKERLTIIESRPCIEFWFLLHYKNTDKCFVNCDEIIVELCKHIPEYCKNQNYITSLYKELKNKLETARQRSEAICKKERVDNEDYSYSGMHILIRILDDLQNKTSPNNQIK